MTRRLWNQYGLKYNPFSPEAPVQAFVLGRAVENFCWRVEHQLSEGGFALLAGEPGTGKSVTLRLLSDRLSKLPDVTVAMLSRPQSSPADFYREMGDLFAVELKPSNRWAGTKVLRQRWLSHIDSSLLRPLLLIDEAQEMSVTLLNELRLLSSVELDAKSVLTVVLSGDRRLLEKLQTPDLMPLAGRIRTQLRLKALDVEELKHTLTHVLEQAGNATLIDKDVVGSRCDQAMGNSRTLMNAANDLLAAAVRDKRDRIDQELFFEVMDLQPRDKRRRRR